MLHAIVEHGLRILVRNETKGSILGDAVEVADTRIKRLLGLLRHALLEPGSGLWIVPCDSIHTFFMRFPIDLIYLDKHRRVKKVRQAVPPWRISACLSACSILELPIGTISRTETDPGDELSIECLQP